MKFLIIFSLVFFQSVTPKQKIFLIGDSTMAIKKAADAPETGWGQALSGLFNDAVEIHNRAVNGRSTKSFRDKGHWADVLENLQKDDYVVIQFGHNDSKENDSERYAAALTAYRENLQKYIEETRKKGAIPVLCTPVQRRKYDKNGNFEDTHGDYPTVVKQVAAKLKVDIIDLHAESRKKIENHGVEHSKSMFMHYPDGVFPKFPQGISDNTHFSPYGAKLIANAFANELMKQKHPLRNFLKKSVFPTKYQYEVPVVYEPVFRKDTFNIIKYGAKSDATFVNTEAIKSAIEAANRAGGGTVIIPAGLWITGPIVLESDVNLHISQGALLRFADDRSHYPIVETTWEGQKAYRCQAPIWGVGLTNIAITGLGVVDGSGHIWKSVKKSKMTESQWKQLLSTGGVVDNNTWYPSESSRIGHNSEWAKKLTQGKTLADFETIKDFLRPNMISLYECNHILVEGVTFQNSPAWTIHPLLCNHTTFRNVNVKNPWYGQNNDAIDLESCRFGIVDACTFDTGDDAITIKSGRDEEGRKRGVPTESIIVTNTTVFHGHGGFVIGSEMSGGVRNMFVNNCTFLGTDIGLRFKTTRGRGGMVNDIFISDIHMTDIVGEAILFDMYYAAQDPIALLGDKRAVPQVVAKPINDGTPVFQDFYMDDVHCKGASAALVMNGLPEMNIKNVVLTNSSISSTEGLKINDSDGVTLQNVNVHHQSGELIKINNSKNITFDAFSHPKSSDNNVLINGPEVKNIKFKNTKDDTSKTAFNISGDVQKSEIIYK